MTSPSTDGIRLTFVVKPSERTEDTKLTLEWRMSHFLEQQLRAFFPAGRHFSLECLAEPLESKHG